MIHHEIILDGDSKETGQILTDIVFHIQNVTNSSNKHEKEHTEFSSKPSKQQSTTPATDNCDSVTIVKGKYNMPWKLTIQSIVIDRTVANSLIELIRAFHHHNHPNHNQNIHIKFYSCIGRSHYAEMVLLTALHVANPTLEIVKCSNFQDTLALLGREIRYAPATLRNLSFVDQVIDEPIAMALSEGLRYNNFLETLNLRNTQFIIQNMTTAWSSSPLTMLLQTLANGLHDACHLKCLNMRFCKLRDEELAILIKSLRSDILEELLLRGNYCREISMNHLATLLEDSHCKMHTLDLSRQYFMGLKKFPMSILATSFKYNRSLQYLDLMSNSLSDQDISILVNGIESSPASLSTTTAPAPAIAIATMNRVPLKQLMLAGSNVFRRRGAEKLLELVKFSNTSIQQILIPVRYPKDIMIQQQIHFYTNWNKCGRRIMYSPSPPPTPLKSSEIAKAPGPTSSSSAQESYTTTSKTSTNVSIPIGLWPIIFGRINELDWNTSASNNNTSTKCINTFNKQHHRHHFTGKRLSKKYDQSTMNPSLMYAMLRNSPALLEH